LGIDRKLLYDLKVYEVFGIRKVCKMVMREIRFPDDNPFNYGLDLEHSDSSVAANYRCSLAAFQEEKDK